MFAVTFKALPQACAAAAGGAGCFQLYRQRFAACEPKPAGIFGGSSRAACFKPLVLVGPSGAGKGSLIEILMKEYPNKIGFSVSSTTRKPRPGEQDGVHYHFVSIEDMRKAIDEGKFVEHANVHTNIYGTSKAALEDVKNAGKIALLDIDVQGARSVKKQYGPDARYIFLAPPSLEVLEARLRGRGTETEEKIKVRMNNASGEVEFSKEPGFWDAVFVSDEAFKKCLPEIKKWLEENYPQLRK